MTNRTPLTETDFKQLATRDIAPDYGHRAAALVENLAVAAMSLAVLFSLFVALLAAA